jgi:hypothetical protein
VGPEKIERDNRAVCLNGRAKEVVAIVVVAVVEW